LSAGTESKADFIVSQILIYHCTFVKLCNSLRTDYIYLSLSASQLKYSSHSLKVWIYFND